MMKSTLKVILVLSLCAVPLFLTTGCKELSSGLIFSHSLHQDEASCADCHSGDNETMRTTMKPCMECHEIDEANPSEECLLCHVLGEEKGYRVKASKEASYSDLIFDHDTHEDVECSTCHAEVATTTSLGGDYYPSMTTCLGCHNGDAAPAECSACHETLRRDEKPQNHTPLWSTSHGDYEEASCGYCHDGQDVCMECHRENKPSSHTAGWKFRGHGFEATLDTDGCNNCHVASYCSDCHSRPPRNHSPKNGWLATGHGIEGSINSDGCFICHKQSEASCRSCHTGGF